MILRQSVDKDEGPLFQSVIRDCIMAEASCEMPCQSMDEEASSCRTLRPPIDGQEEGRRVDVLAGTEADESTSILQFVDEEEGTLFQPSNGSCVIVGGLSCETPRQSADVDEGIRVVVSTMINIGPSYREAQGHTPPQSPPLRPASASGPSSVPCTPRNSPASTLFPTELNSN